MAEVKLPKLTPRLQVAIGTAVAYAAQEGREYVDTVDMLRALMNETEGEALAVLKAAAVDFEALTLCISSCRNFADDNGSEDNKAI